MHIYNNLKITFRNLHRNGIYSVINIAGLAISLTVVLTIAVWIENELNFNRWYSNSNRLYVTCADDGHTGVSESFINMLRTEFPEVKRVSYFENTDDVLMHAWEDNLNTYNELGCLLCMESGNGEPCERIEN